MADDPAKEPQLEIHSDEDWKERVKAEDARLDTERATKSASAAPPDTGQPDTRRPQSAQSETVQPRTAQPAESPAEDLDPSLLPPPEFAVLVEMFSTQAMVALGMLPDPASGQPEVRPVLARHYLNMLTVLEQKTQGNLTKDEQRLLESSLHHLRLAYLQLLREAREAAGTA